jgi:recombination protein RecA
MSAAALLRSQVTDTLGSRFEVSFEIGRHQHKEMLLTGIAALDQLTGGFPRGALTEISGPVSSGRTTVARATLASASNRGEFCAWIDAADAFDPVSAGASGVRLEKILWVRCGGSNAAESALKAADLLVQAGGFGLIVMDLADTPRTAARRISLASWFRLRHAVERTNSVLVAVEQEINARSCSTLQIEMRLRQPLWSGSHYGTLLEGLGVELATRKHFRSQTAQFEARW